MSKPIWIRDDATVNASSLRKCLAAGLGTVAASYPKLAVGRRFDADVEAALQRWQADVGLVADGIVGPRVKEALGLAKPRQWPVAVDALSVGRLFPFTRASNVARHLPYVLSALAAFGLADRLMLVMALATIRVETEGFMPIAEAPSRFNTLPGMAAFSAYEGRLGNRDTGDGARYRGRGFVQLTGRDNYATYGKSLGIPLVDRPELACAPEIAACLLAAYLASRESAVRKALQAGDLARARALVNGGTHGLDRFAALVQAADTLWPMTGDVALLTGATGAASAAPPSARGGRRYRAAVTVDYREVRATLNVGADVSDLRDRIYAPPPVSLPAQFPDEASIRARLKAYTGAGLILDQGREGACTGFGLACVINYLRWRVLGMPATLPSVSPRMLYDMARRYDEYEGEDYEGSSCRGALKGWHRHGVCLADDWPYTPGSSRRPQPGFAERAIEQTLGVYYRIEVKAIADLQAAIHEVGAISVSAYTHAGWEDVAAGDRAARRAPTGHDSLPHIPFAGRRSRSGGHAFALVGFNRNGFIVQNSWGTGWGAGGFAVLTYADWLANAMDAWVAALGVPGVVGGAIRPASSATGMARAGVPAHWWSPRDAYAHSIVFGNNGRVVRYETQDEATRTLQYQASVRVDEWFRRADVPAKKRLVVYAHGGLNSEADAIERARALGPYFFGNGCYPLFLIWKTGVLESIGNILADKLGLTGKPERARGLGELIAGVTDRIVETTIGRPFARPIWSEMKENAALAVNPGRGGHLLADALRTLAARWGDAFELHLVGHSAGSILFGHLLQVLAQNGLAGRIASIQLYAPACTVEFANRYYAPHPELMRHLHLDLLHDDIEQGDNVAQIYRKSLLYLISNALEADRATPVLGMHKAYDDRLGKWDGSSSTAEALANWRRALDDADVVSSGRLRIHAASKIVTRATPPQRENASHGGFDNDLAVVGATLERITGGDLALPVTDLTGF